MRNIGTLPDRDQAARFLGYLQKLDISAETRESDDGWKIWIHHEKSTDAARQEFSDFCAEPEHPRYVEARPAKLPKEPAKEEGPKPPPRRHGEFRREWRADGGNQATLALIAISVGVSFFVWRLGDGNALEQTLTILPFQKIQDKVFAVRTLADTLKAGEIWRLVTPIFLHGGWIHLIFNMYATFFLGSMIEMRIGTMRFLRLALAVAVISNVAQYFDNWYFGGMSGVVYGLLGYVWMKARYAPNLGYDVPRDLIAIALIWAVFCLLSSYIANTAHFVGLAVGCAAGAVPELLRRRG